MEITIKHLTYFSFTIHSINMTNRNSTMQTYLSFKTHVTCTCILNTSKG